MTLTKKLLKMKWEIIIQGRQKLIRICNIEQLFKLNIKRHDISNKPQSIKFEFINQLIN